MPRLNLLQSRRQTVFEAMDPISLPWKFVRGRKTEKDDIPVVQNNERREKGPTTLLNVSKADRNAKSTTKWFRHRNPNFASLVEPASSITPLASSVHQAPAPISQVESDGLLHSLPKKPKIEANDGLGEDKACLAESSPPKFAPHTESAYCLDDESSTDNTETTTIPSSTYSVNIAQPQQQTASYQSLPEYLVTGTNPYSSSETQQQAQQSVQYLNSIYQRATTVYLPYYPHFTIAQNASSYALGPPSAASDRYSYVSDKSMYLPPDLGGPSTSCLDRRSLAISQPVFSEGTDSKTPLADSFQELQSSHPMPSQDGYKKPHTCWEIIEGRDCGAAFKRKADLIRHRRVVHNADEERWYCDAPGCDRNKYGINAGFTRRDHLVEHLRSYHHRNIPKRKRGRGLEDKPESSTAYRGNAYAEQATWPSY